MQSKPTLDTLLNHRSIRKYTKQPISPETLTAILNAGRAVSTSSYLQAVSIIRVTDPQKRTAFRQISNDLSEQAYQELLAQGKRLGHAYVESAAEFLVFCMDGHRHKTLVPEAQLDWTEVSLIGCIDAALMAQNVLAAAESLGLGGVFIGSLRNDIARASEILKLPTHVVPLFGLCLGYPDLDAPINQGQRPRLPLHVVVSENQYTPASDQALQEYNETVHAYYQTRKLDLDWTAQIRATFAKPVRPEILAFLQKQGFNLR